LGDVEDLGKAGVLIAAERRVDHMVGNDARFVRRVADPAERALGNLARLGNAQADARGHRGVRRRSAAAISSAAFPAEGRARTRAYHAPNSGWVSRPGPFRRIANSTVMKSAMSATENAPQKYSWPPSSACKSV